MKSTHPANGFVITNPGATQPVCYSETADVFTTYENSAANYNNLYFARGWEHTVSPSKFWHMVYGATSDQYDAIISKAIERGVGRLFITNYTGWEAYSNIPGDWDKLNSLVSLH